MLLLRWSRVVLLLAVVLGAGLFGARSVGADNLPVCFRAWGTYGSGVSQFIYPQSVALDSAGNVYVADTDNSRIQKFTSAGVYITQWGSEGTGPDQLDYPHGVAVDSAGNVYVADTNNSRIVKFTSTGMPLAQWGSYGVAHGEFNHPYGVAVDSAGNVYVADTYMNRIQKFTSGGEFITTWGLPGPGNGQFNIPEGVAVDPTTGNVYVADTYNNRIQLFTSGGAYLTQWGSPGSGDSEFNRPQGVAVVDDGEGSSYVADTDNNRIQLFIYPGVYSAQWGSLGNGSGQFIAPSGLVVDSVGNIYIADTDMDRIQECGYLPELWTPTATAITTTTATLGATATSAAPLTALGVVYAPTATNSNPTIGGTGVTQVPASPGGGALHAFTVNVSGLTPGTAYSYAAYATNVVGTRYSSVANFTTAKAATTTTLTSSPNPSLHGQPVTFTATVNGAAGTPTGSVQFSLDGSPAGSAAPLSATGSASYQTSDLAVGAHTVTASYSGDSHYAGSSGSLSGGQQVNLAATTMTLVSSPNPSLHGQPVTFTATVSAASGTPSGTVAFSDGSAPAGSATLNQLSPNQASFTTSALPVGTHTITAGYNGDSDFASSSASLSGGQQVDLAADLSVNLTGPASGTITRGGTLSYAIVVANAGPDPASAVSLTNDIETKPDDVRATPTFQSLTAPSGWSCTTPAVGGTGRVTCTTTSLAVGASASFALAVKAPQGNISGLVFSDTASVKSDDVDDPVARNDTATVTTAATAPPPAPGGGHADLVVSQTAEPPNGAKVGGTVTFRVKVTNTGPDTATGVHLTVTLSGVGVIVRAEGRCGPPAGSTVSCELGTLSNHASAVVTITAKPAAAGTLRSTATVASSSTDPTAANNTATASEPIK